jgi:hypothetical protein
MRILLFRAFDRRFGSAKLPRRRPGRPRLPLQRGAGRHLYGQSFAHVERFIIADALPAEIRETQT